MPEVADVLSVDVATRGTIAGGAVFDLSRLRVPFTMLVLGNVTHIVMSKSGRAVHLCVAGDLPSPTLCLMAPALVAPERLARHHLFLSRLNEVCHHGVFRPSLFPPDNRSQRLRSVLTALDGRLAGQTNREIAITLFGEKRVNADWNDPGGWLRDRVRRAICRGNFLMNGGYRQLLK